MFYLKKLGTIYPIIVTLLACEQTNLKTCQVKTNELAKKKVHLQNVLQHSKKKKLGTLDRTNKRIIYLLSMTISDESSEFIKKKKKGDEIIPPNSLS